MDYSYFVIFVDGEEEEEGEDEEVGEGGDEEEEEGDDDEEYLDEEEESEEEDISQDRQSKAGVLSPLEEMQIGEQSNPASTSKELDITTNSPGQGHPGNQGER